MQKVFMKYNLKTLVILITIAVLSQLLFLIENIMGGHDAWYVEDSINGFLYYVLLRMLELLPIYILSFFLIIENKITKMVARLGQLICVIGYIAFLGCGWGYEIILFIQKYYVDQIIFFDPIENVLYNLYFYGKTSAYIISFILIIIYRSKILKGELFRE